MTSRYPLTLNDTSSTIEELPASIDLDLSGSNISNVGNIVAGNSMSANYFVGTLYGTANIANVAYSVAGANVSGTVANATFATSAGSANTANTANSATTAATVTTNAQPNITSVGNLTGVTVTGTSTLGNIGNVKITGGSTAQVIQTDGAGNLSFASISAASYQLKPVRAATVSSITLSGTQTVDGVSLIAGDRVLVWFQNSNVVTGDINNGIYVVQSGGWTRAADFNTGAETLSGGVSVIASEGTNQKGVVFSCNNTGTITIGLTNISFVRNINQSGFINISTNTSSTNLRPASVGINSGAIAIGVAANSSADGVSIGYESFVTGGGSVGIGYQAKTRDFSVSIGRESGVTDQDRQVNIGRFAGRYNQGTDITAIGAGAHGTYFTPAGATAVGADSGIAGANSVAIGREAGRISSGGGASHSIAIGFQSAYQVGNANVIAIGSTASYLNPRAESIAIGREAGYANIGDDSIAIGGFAGRTNQANNSIILNATGANLNQTTANTFTVKPIRNAANTNVMMYDATSGEVTYDTLANYTGNITTTGSVTAGAFFKYPVYTAAALTAITGQVGWSAAVSNSGGGGNPNGMIAFWDTTNTRWSYIHDNSAV